jgi:Ni2+-binding GTPase involved in maturation of urease and hydrogenase
VSDPVIDAVAICMQARLPCNIEGAPGTGKTSITKAIVGRMGETAHTVILSVRDATDQGGLPPLRSTRRPARSTLSWSLLHGPGT